MWVAGRGVHVEQAARPRLRVSAGLQPPRRHGQLLRPLARGACAEISPDDTATTGFRHQEAAAACPSSPVRPVSPRRNWLSAAAAPALPIFCLLSLPVGRPRRLPFAHPNSRCTRLGLRQPDKHFKRVGPNPAKFETVTPAALCEDVRSVLKWAAIHNATAEKVAPPKKIERGGAAGRLRAPQCGCTVSPEGSPEGLA